MWNPLQRSKTKESSRIRSLETNTGRLPKCMLEHQGKKSYTNTQFHDN